MGIFGLVLGLLCFPLSASARVHVASVPSKVLVKNQTLVFNGSGVRSIFFMDIYRVALYLPQASSTADFMMQNIRPVQLRMVFLRGGAGRKMLARGWRKGFEHNQSVASMHVLEARLQEFSNFFGDVEQGDVFTFDFLVNGNTKVYVNGKIQGVIHGTDFQQALLAIWLGKRPVGDKLKAELLGRE